ncbi:hypothetical protein DBP88_14175 [Enterobacter hormaechei]|nr:hypothetical protein DBP88_14175 [Enterobacter hormaechei]
MFWGEAAWEIGDTHSVYVSASYFTIGQAGGPGSSVSSDLEHIAGVTSGLHHQSISIHQPTQQRSFYATAKLYRSQIIGTTNAFGNPGDVGVFGECFGLADGYQLVGEVMAHQGDDGLPCFIVGSQHQSISPASAGNDRG